MHERTTGNTVSGPALRTVSVLAPPPASSARASAHARPNSSAICSSDQASVQRQLSGCLTQLDLPQLPYQALPRPPIYGTCTSTSTSSAVIRVAPVHTPLGSQDRLAAAGCSPRQFAASSGLQLQAAPARPVAASAQSVPFGLQEPDGPGDGAGQGMPWSMEEDVEGSLVSALEAHIAQHLADDSPLATCAGPCSASSSCRSHAGTQELCGPSGRGAAIPCRSMEPVSRQPGQPEPKRLHPVAGNAPVQLRGRGELGTCTRQPPGRKGATADGSAYRREQDARGQQQQQGSVPSSLRIRESSARGAHGSRSVGREGRGRKTSRKRGQGDSESDGEEYAEELARMIEKQLCAENDSNRNAGEHTACACADYEGQQVASSSRPQLPALRHAKAAAAMQRVRNTLGH